MSDIMKLKKNYKSEIIDIENENENENENEELDLIESDNDNYEEGESIFTIYDQ